MARKKMGRPSAKELKLRADSKRVMERYYYNRDAGICPHCGQRDAALGHIYCQECIDRGKALMDKRDPGHEKSKAKKKRQYAERVAKGLCVDCGKPTRNGYKRCNRCLENNRWNHKIWQLRKKLKEGQA